MEGEIIFQYHVFRQDPRHPRIGEEVGVGKLVMKENIPAQVIYHVHVEVLSVAGPPVRTYPARVDIVDVVGEVVAVCCQEGFVKDFLQHQQLAL